MSLSEAYVADDGRIRRQPRDKGDLNEDRALWALIRPEWKKPDWFRQVRLSTELEDFEEQTDLVIYSNDRGQYFVQIKSSSRAKRRFQRSLSRRDIACVVLLDTDTFDDICRKIIEAVEIVRKARRTRHCRNRMHEVNPRNPRRR